MVKIKKTKKVALIALVPVIHANYLRLFKKYNQTLFILGESILSDWEYHKHLHRDLRRLDQKLIADLVQKSGILKQVIVLEKNNLNFIDEFDSFILPDEDVSHWFSENFLKNKKVKFEKIFLRWNKLLSTVELQIHPDRKITKDEFHRKMIKKAERLAQKSANWWRQIGTLAVKDNEIIAEAFNAHVPTQYNIEVYGDMRSDFDAGQFHQLSNSIHGEASLISNCAKLGISLLGADLYVTTFPCPTCAKLIANSGIKEVYYKEGYSLSDAEDILKNAGVKIFLVQ